MHWGDEDVIPRSLIQKMGLTNRISTIIAVRRPCRGCFRDSSVCGSKIALVNGPALGIGI